MSSTKPVGILHFSSLEYFPVGYYVDTEDGKEVFTNNGQIASLIESHGKYVSPSFQCTSNDAAAEELEKIYCVDAKGNKKPTWEAHYSHDDDYGFGADYNKDDYDAEGTMSWNSEIRQWLNLVTNSDSWSGDSFMVEEIKNAIYSEYDIVIAISNAKLVVENDPSASSAGSDTGITPDEAEGVSPPVSANTGLMHWEISFMYEITDRGKEGILKYDINVNYSGVLTRTIVTKKSVPTQYMAHCEYVGIVRKTWISWDGMAFYMGSVTKGNSVGNMNPETDNEIIMYPDEDGFLRQIVYGYNEEEQKPEIRSYYRVEADYVWLTDVFKNDKPCFYKYRLKKPIYDYRGPDSRGFYSGDAVGIYNAAMKHPTDDYVHNIKLTPMDYDVIEKTDSSGNTIETLVPNKYYADLYCSYVSSSTDTYTAVYNAFDDSDSSDIDLENGVTEKIYNYPWSRLGIDFDIISVIPKARVNKIRLRNYTPIEDTRRYVNVKYEVIVERKKDGKIFTSNQREARILNREYAFESESYMFEGRGYIISPELDGDGIKASPRDIIFRDQGAKIAEDEDFEPVIGTSDTDFVYKCNIISMSGDGTDIKTVNDGSVNIKCNPDGSGVITAETTIDTGFYDEEKGTYTKMLNMDSPYWVEKNYIHPGWCVKCIDSRYIKVNNPREDGLLESWYPLIQFGHYTRILDQYGTHLKVCYSMPEYDTQKFSDIYGKPIMDVEKERIEIINPHMVKAKKFPLYVHEPDISGSDVYYYGSKIYKVFKQRSTWHAAHAVCANNGGVLAMPRNRNEVEFIRRIAVKYDMDGLWLGATDEAEEGVWRWNDGTLMQYDNWAEYQPDNGLAGNEHYLGTYTKDADGKWFDLPQDAEIDGFICEIDKLGVMLYKKVGDELYNINVTDVSFSDGIIITSDIVSENDELYCSYHYLEENYSYRGWWRDVADFVRLDLNPNIYHTYNDPQYTPSEVKPSKNLFNKIIYFFMKPSIMYEMDSDYDDLYYNANKFVKVEVKKTRTVTKTRQVEHTINTYDVIDLELLPMFPEDEHDPIKELTEFIADDYIGPISVAMPSGHFHGFKILELNGNGWVQCATSTMDNATHSDTVALTVTIDSVTLKRGYKYKIVVYECQYGIQTVGKFNYTIIAPDAKALVAHETTEIVDEEYTEEEEYTEIEYRSISNDEGGKVVKEYDTCLYHKIDDNKPDDEEDMLVGSVYIRQNTSLHSTVIVDARTRGGGVLEEIEDTIRHALEPESDFYLDIGYYDGEPYQENGVIIIRLDNKLLKEYGGRFTRGDIEQKVKRWLAFGVYPIIEFVDAYTKYELPQYTLEIEEEYANVMKFENFDFIVECVNVT